MNREQWEALPVGTVTMWKNGNSFSIESKYDDNKSIVLAEHFDMFDYDCVGELQFQFNEDLKKTKVAAKKYQDMWGIDHDE